MPATPATTPRLGLARYDNNVDPADFATQVNAISDRLDLIVQMRDESLPIGGQAPYGGIGDPTGGKWLLCDGRALNVADYGEVHAVIGFRYSPGGIDPGTGQFNLPDKRGRGSVGSDTMATPRGSAGRVTTAKGHPNALGQNGGFERHKLVRAEIAAHDHPASQVPHGHVAQLPITAGATAVGDSGRAMTSNGDGNNYSMGLATDDKQPAVTVSNMTGGDGEHNNMSPYEVDNWIIRVR